MPAILKTFTAKVTAAPDGDDVQPGEFEALVSAFGVTDSYGDVIEKGAYADSLKEWAERGRPIPVVWSHQFGDPDAILGHYTHAEETDDGLLMRGQFDLDHPKAVRVHALLAQGLVAEFSISGEIREYELIEDEDEEDAWWPGLRILNIDLWEAGPCFKGANPATELISIKAADLTGPIARRIRAHRAETAGREETVESLSGDVVRRDPAPAEEADATPSVQQAAAVTPNVRALLELSTIQ